MSCNRKMGGSLISGLVIVTIGVVLLLGQLGVVDTNAIWRFWPAIFCIVGISRIGNADNMASRAWGTLLVFLGGVLIAHEFGYFRYGLSQLWPAFIIGTGLLMIWRHYDAAQGGGLSSDSDVQTFSVFGGSERRINAKDFKGGQSFALFGGFKLDLTQADIDGAEAKVDATVLFGGGEIFVPRTWTVIVKGIGVFGGYADQTRQEIVSGTNPKTLVVTGMAMFGGVEVKN